VLETNWHPSQQVDSTDPNLKLPLNWRVQVADATDMLPWVRGWGADVRVIQPEWMRNEIGEHVRAMSQAYGLVQSRAMGDVSGAPAHHWLWAKASTSGNLHRLVYHMIDVGQCAHALWQRVLNTNIKQRIANWLGLSEEAAGRLVAFWASLHDLGKASPAFQDHPNLRQKNPRLHRRMQEELAAVGLGSPQRSAELPHARHEVVSTYALRSSPTPNMGEGLLAKLSQLPEDVAVMIADMLGGHHGAFPTSGALSPTQLQLADRQNGKDDGQWAQARVQLFAEMQAVFQPPLVTQFEEDPLRDNPTLMLLAGIVSAADWLGSDETTFPLTSELMPTAA
jgi:CRISPR-associated endonuclease/helicase Cas3